MRFIKSAICTAALLALTTTATPSFAGTPEAAAVDVVINQTQLLHLRQPMGSIIVGNPEIAAVSVHDDHTLLLTGLTFGTTNLIVLDSVGRTIYSSKLLVTENSDSGTLTIARGSSKTDTYTCSDKCRTATSEDD